jgi:hypothetical protein
MTYGNFTTQFLKDLAARLSGRRVFEVFAGSGKLAAELTARGAQVTATSLPHYGGTIYHPVVSLSASEAVRHFGNEHDVLLMCWPTVTLDATLAVFLWGTEKDVIFIGEMTDYSRGLLGGCATDGFFDATEVTDSISTYQARSLIERAVVLRVRENYIDDWKMTGRLPPMQTGPAGCGYQGFTF